MENLQKTADSLGKEDVLFIRLHPHIATHLKETLEGWKEKRIYNVSEYPEIGQQQYLHILPGS